MKARSVAADPLAEDDAGIPSIRRIVDKWRRSGSRLSILLPLIFALALSGDATAASAENGVVVRGRSAVYDALVVVKVRNPGLRLTGLVVDLPAPMDSIEQEVVGMEYASGKLVRGDAASYVVFDYPP